MATYFRYGKEWKRKDKLLKNDTNINVRICSDDLDKLRAVAKENNVKYSKIVRKLIEDYNNGLIKVEL